MGYDHGDSFAFEPNEIPLGSKSKGKLSPRLYPIQFERKWKYSFLSAYDSSQRGEKEGKKEGNNAEGGHL